MRRFVLAFLVVMGCAVLLLNPGESAAICGDSILDPGEMCDPPDGNCCLPGCYCDAGEMNLCGPVCFGGTSSCQLKSTGCPCSPDPVCPLAAGTYTMTIVGGSTVVGPAPPVPQVVGGTTVLEVGPPDADCVHPIVIPMGGYSIPLTCVFGAVTAMTTQTACGVGLLDSDGGADFDLVEVGDTSSPTTCGLPHAGCTPGSDASLQIDVTLGDGSADSCVNGKANLLTSVPITTLSWIDVGGCPAPDGTYDPASGDVLAASLTLTIDTTTATSSADWADLDVDACCLAGSGPASPPCGPPTGSGYSGSGDCLDFATGMVVTTATAPVASPSAVAGSDVTLLSIATHTFAPSGPPGSSTCATPLPSSAMTTTRCVP